MENLKSDEKGVIQLSEIQERVSEKFTGHHIGGTINKLFQNITTKRARNKLDWTKSTTNYYGISFKLQKNQKVNMDLSFTEIHKFVGENFFLINSNANELSLGYFNGYIVNGNRMITELIFSSSGIFSVKISGKLINLENLHISNTFALNEKSVRSAAEAVKSIQLCNAVNEKEVSNMGFKEKSRVEHRSVTHDENSGYVVCKMLTCLEVIPYMSNFPECSECRKLKSTVTVKSTENVCNDNSIQLIDSDSSDMQNVLEKVLGDFTVKQKLFFQSQTENLNCTPLGRRWNPEVIRLCLSIYSRSPRTYEDLRNSGYVCLPSSKLIRMYKNQVSQIPGIQKECLSWMANEAQRLNLSPDGYEGGLMIDEMSIQEDLFLKKKGNGFELVGFVDISDESVLMNKLLTGGNERKLAHHVLQLVFLGNSGFRFPFAHFPVTTTSAPELFLIFWKAIKMLNIYGFTVRYVSLDGAQSNRDFMKMLLLEQKTDTLKTMLLANLYDPLKPKIAIIMDFSHVIKKIRNNLSKSGFSSGHKRKIKCESSYIIWDHWIRSYNWDISHNPFPVHRKLTHEHFYLTSESKMRNTLAEDVLDSEMLHVMLCYQKSLGDNPKAHELNGTIRLLRNTSVIIKNFRDHRPIKDSSDERLRENEQVLTWFQAWENEIRSDDEIKDKEKSLISFQCREDIFSLLKGFGEFCHEKFRVSGGSVIPNRVNSDVIENVFSQQRGMHNGCNTNPTYQHYCNTMNSIILGESSVSKKSNTGGESGAAPLIKKGEPKNSSPVKKIPKL